MYRYKITFWITFLGIYCQNDYVRGFFLNPCYKVILQIWICDIKYSICDIYYSAFGLVSSYSNREYVYPLFE